MTIGGTPLPAGQLTPEQEDAAVAYVLELVRLEQNGERCEIRIGPYGLFTTIGAMQLALRHPGMGGRTATLLTQLVEQWRTPFRGTMGDVWITAGYHREYDGDGKPGAWGTFEAWLAARYPDPVGRQCIEASEEDLRDAWFAGRASLTAGGGPQ